MVSRRATFCKNCCICSRFSKYSLLVFFSKPKLYPTFVPLPTPPPPIFAPFPPCPRSHQRLPHCPLPTPHQCLAPCCLHWPQQSLPLNPPPHPHFTSHRKKSPPVWNNFWDGLKLRLRVNSAKYIARKLSQIVQNVQNFWPVFPKFWLQRRKISQNRVFLVLWKSSRKQFARPTKRSTKILIFLKLLLHKKILEPTLRGNDCF